MTTLSRKNIEAAEAETQAPNLQRGLAILEFIAAARRGVTLSELSRELEISVSSVFRIGAALVELGYLSRDEKTKAYHLTRKFLMMGQPQGSDQSLVEAAIEPMRELRRLTGETVQVGCLAGSEFVIIDQLVATHPFKYVVDLGARVPVHTCAPGKAMLAFLRDEDRDGIIDAIKFRRYTPSTIVSKRQLHAELDLVRERGYAVDRAEGLEGIHCIGAPMLNRHGEPVAALTIAGPCHRLPADRFDDLGQLVITAARDAARRFGL